MIRMKKQDKEAWLKALREETYPRGKGRLKDENGGYCCIGVLQMALDGKVETWSAGGSACGMPTPRWWETKGITALGTCADVSQGLVALTPQPYKEGEMEFDLDYIPQVNDKTNLTFPEIADLLDPIIEVY